jgi:hypothetical protein
VLERVQAMLVADEDLQRDQHRRHGDGRAHDRRAAGVAVPCR